MISAPERTTLVQTISNAIFLSEQQRMDRLLGELILENSYLHPESQSCFTYRGRIFTLLPGIAKREVKKPIHVTLEPKIQDLMPRLDHLATDRRRVDTFLHSLVVRCQDLQDVRDTLPNLVVERLEGHEIRGLPRTRAPMYLLAGDPIKQHSYEKMTELIFLYLANELVL